MMIKTKIFVILTTLLLSLNAYAQSFEGVLSARVYKETVDGKVFFEENGTKYGKYESIDIMIIDNTVVLRVEEGETNERGFVEEDKIHSIMFRLSNIKMDFTGHSCDWYGEAASNMVRNGQPMNFKIHLGESDYMTVAIGGNIMYCKGIRNRNMGLLAKYSEQVSNPQTTTSSKLNNSNNKDSKSSSKKTTKPPLKK